MNALVTGAAGFIGSHLVERLSLRGDRARCLIRRSAAPDRIATLKRCGAQLIEADCCSTPLPPEVFEGITHVFHLAGTTRERHHGDYSRGNTVATERFAEACRRSGAPVERFVYVSSIAALGPSFDGVPVDEDTPPHPVSEYGRTKLQAEAALRRVAGTMPWTILRPTAVYGPRDRDLFDYFRLISFGLFPAAGSFDSQVNLVSWSDIVDAILLAAEAPAANGAVVHVGDARSYSTGEVGAAIARVMDRHPLRIRLPHAFVEGISATAEFVGRVTRRPVFLTREKAKELLAPAWTCSIERAQRLLGYQPRVALEDGLRATYHWYRSEGLLN